jgi:hypothetical protein
MIGLAVWAALPAANDLQLWDDEAR